MEEQPSRSNTLAIDSVVQEMLLSVLLDGLKQDSLHYVEPWTLTLTICRM